MTVLILAGVGIAKIYYGNLNASEDPRVVKAKHLYKKYNTYAENNDFEAVFALLDSILNIYSKFPDYKKSYETGVVYNNIGATFLSSFLFNSSDSASNNLLDSANYYCLRSVDIYKYWMDKFESKNENEIKGIVETYYIGNDDFFNDKNIDKIKRKRVKDIQEAQKETPRRLSVTYTNLGIIARHKMLYNEAVDYYRKALKLWEDNLTAKNNLNILLGREKEERSTIEKLFPKKK